MKLVSVFSTVVLGVALGVAVPVYAQQDDTHPRDDKRVEEDKAAEHQDKHAEQEDKAVEHQEKKERDDKTVTREREETRTARIPDDKFRAHFGRAHSFRIGHPVIVEGSPRFQYGGYWFVIAQPWPAGWGYNDQVYVDYVDGGYFLFSPVHPGIQISINVVL
jgi:hypothetical protein